MCILTFTYESTYVWALGKVTIYSKDGQSQTGYCVKPVSGGEEGGRLYKHPINPIKYANIFFDIGKIPFYCTSTVFAHSVCCEY